MTNLFIIVYLGKGIRETTNTKTVTFFQLEKEPLSSQ